MELPPPRDASRTVFSENVVIDVGDLSVRPLERLRPVPPPRPARPTSPPTPDLPVYDPFSARRRRMPQWQVNYTASLVVTDLVAAAVAVVAAANIHITGSRPLPFFAVAAVVLWPGLLGSLGTYAERRLGTGFDEYRRVVDVGLIVLGASGVFAALMPGMGFGRLLVLGVPIVTTATLLGRVLNRRRLHANRRRGLMTKRVVVVGAEPGVLDLVSRMSRDRVAGLKIVAACLPKPPRGTWLAQQGIPVLGLLDDVLRVVDRVRADAVLVAAATETSGHYMRDLAWRLEGTNIELLVGPGLIEVAPSRLQVRPTTSVPLIQILEPEFRGWQRVLKELCDRIGAAVLLMVSAPLFLVIGLAMTLTDRGPVLYRHRRIGMQGREFDLLKFRSMVHGADRQEQVLMAFNECNEVQFKLRRDPRVTRIGALLRRSSLDELPQLFNVLKGEMSLVGPRPHVTREVQMYGPDMQRRLLVKPGITGLWQVSGRSNLSWDEAVELDVRYVENWSIGLDLLILARTLRAVIKGQGAY